MKIYFKILFLIFLCFLGNTSWAKTNCQLQTKTELFYSYFAPNTTVSTDVLDPFEPIVFVNQSDLGMLTDVANGQQIFVSPAIILRYADEKAWNQTAADAGMAAIDAATLATGYGELQAGVTGLRKAWAIADMLNGGINLGLNASGASQNETVKKVLDAYNLATGSISLTRMATGGVRSVYSLIKGKNILQQKDLEGLIKAINSASPEDLKALSTEDAQQISGLIQRVKFEAQIKELGDLEQNADEALAALRGNATTAEAIPNLVNKTDNVIDDITSAALQTQDVADEIVKTNNTLSDAAKKFWANHETNATIYLRNKYGNANVGSQITADITLSDGSVFTCRFDDLVKDGNLYKIIDAKSSITQNLSTKTAEDLASNWSTTNQQKFYNALKNGQVKSITPKGERANNYFLNNLGETEIPSNLSIENKIEFLVNDVPTDGYNIFIKILNF